MEDYDGYQFIPTKMKRSENPILNKIGDLCGTIANMFFRPYLRWGTYYVFEMDDEWHEDPETGDGWKLVDKAL